MEPTDVFLPSPKELVTEFGIRSRRSWGQCFLANARMLGQIAVTARLNSETAAIEIGAGPGYLTARIRRRTPHVWAIEIDERFRAVHERHFAGLDPPVRFLYADALRIDWRALLGEIGEKPYAIVGNIPYQITSPLLERLLNLSPPPVRIVLLVQVEFAQRLAAQPGRRTYGSLTVKTALVARVRQALFVPRRLFQPRPRVDAAAILIEPRRPPLVAPEDLHAAFRLINACFTQRRKKLVNSLLGSRHLGEDRDTIASLLSEAKIDPSQRPEQLAVEEFVRLWETVHKSGAAPAARLMARLATTEESMKSEKNP